MVPVVIVTLSEHIGHQMVLSKVVGRNFLKKPGLHRSILGDGAGIMIGSFIGGPPLTSYGENIGVLDDDERHIVCISLVVQQSLQSSLVLSVRFQQSSARYLQL